MPICIKTHTTCLLLLWTHNVSVSIADSYNMPACTVEWCKIYHALWTHTTCTSSHNLPFYVPDSYKLLAGIRERVIQLFSLQFSLINIYICSVVSNDMSTYIIGLHIMCAWIEDSWHICSYNKLILVCIWTSTAGLSALWIHIICFYYMNFFIIDSYNISACL
jgi:hypothetical protein